MLKKRFGLMRYGGIALTVLFAFSFSVARAQTVNLLAPTFVGAKVDTNAIQLQSKNLAGQGAQVLATPIFLEFNSAVTGDTIFVVSSGTFHFAGGPYGISKFNSIIGLDSARVSAGGDSLAIAVTTNGSGTDSIEISGVKVVPVTVSAPSRYLIGAPTAQLTVTSDSALTGGGTLVKGVALLPGNFYEVNPSLIEARTTITAGDTNQATTYNVLMNLEDFNGNPAFDSTSSPTLAPNASLVNTSLSPGNGNVLYNRAPYLRNLSGAQNQIGYVLGYTKVEPTLYFAWISPGNNTFSSAITVNPGAPANISVALVGSNSDTITVTGSTQYTATVTDKYGNQASNPGIALAEKTPHGAGAPTITGTNPYTVTFTPSPNFVGLDTLVFTSPVASPTATYNRVILINPGPIGGIVADFSGSATGATASENVAVGTQIYVRGFLTDAFGNPINATSGSQVGFSVGSATETDGASFGTATTASVSAAIASTLLGKALTSPVSVVAIPYTTSDTLSVLSSNAITATTTSGSYTSTVTINLRSNVPAKMKMVQTVGTDSSVVVSNYANPIAFTDTLWDSYGNLSVAPSSATIPPLKSAYAIYFSTKGFAKFAHGITAGDTTAADTVYPNASGAVTTTNLRSSKVAGADVLTSVSAANSALTKSAPVWVTPGQVASISLYPQGYVASATKDTTAVAGRSETLFVQQFDQYGNHVDWGQPGNTLRSTYKAAFQPRIELAADTVSSGHNRGGYINESSFAVVNFNDATPTKADTGLASVGGDLIASAAFVPYTITADTQKVFAIDTVTVNNINIVFKDTLTVYSIPTGILNTFTPFIAKADSVHNAGDSVLVTFTAIDTNKNTIYTYVNGGVTLTLNHTAFQPVASKDTTFYFDYIKYSNGAPVDTISTTGATAITDTIFNQGMAKIWLRKFRAEDSVNTVTLTVGPTSATSSNGVMFKPLAATPAGPNSKWAIQVADTLNPTGSFTFTVVPRDQYYNVDSVNQYIASIVSNQTSAFNVGSNPKVIQGPTTFTGTLTSATNPFVMNVLNNNNSAVYATRTILLSGQTKLIKGDVAGIGKVVAYDASLILKYLVGDTTFTQQQLAAADVAGTGTVTAYDASLVLRFVAGDSTVDSLFAKTLKGSKFAVQALPAAGSIAIGAAESGTDGLLNVPVTISQAKGVYSAQVTLNVGTADVNVSVGNLPKGWISEYHNANGVLKIAMAGTTPLSSGDIATLSFKLQDPSQKIDMTGSAMINNNPEQDLGNMEVAAVPAKFDLDQNYPNPFNPTTTIKYQLAKPSNVTLQVYNVMGQLVTTLVNKNQNAGYYTIIWNGLNEHGEQVATGVYFYRLNAGSFNSIKKMLLLK